MTPDSGTPRSLGGRLREARKRRRLTQQQLAAKTGLGQSALSSLESDDTKAPHASTLLRLAAALDVDPYWLHTGQGEPGAYQSADSLVAKVGRLSPANRHAVEVMVDALLADQSGRKPSPADPFPNVPTPARKARKPIT